MRVTSSAWTILDCQIPDRFLNDAVGIDAEIVKIGKGPFQNRRNPPHVPPFDRQVANGLQFQGRIVALHEGRGKVQVRVPCLRIRPVLVRLLRDGVC